MPTLTCSPGASVHVYVPALRPSVASWRLRGAVMGLLGCFARRLFRRINRREQRSLSVGLEFPCGASHGTFWGFSQVI